VTFKRELQPEPSVRIRPLPELRQLALYVDPVRGERVCDNCGFVVDESLVDQGPDWTTFEGTTGSGRAAAVRDGAGQRARVYGGQRPTGREGNPIDARSVAALNRLRRVSQWTRYDRTERALAPGLAQLSSLSSRSAWLGFRERAAIILRKAIEAGLSAVGRWTRLSPRSSTWRRSNWVRREASTNCPRRPA